MPVKDTLSPAVQLAQELFKEYYASCFWHWKPDLIISESHISGVAKGLCMHGDREALLAATQLQCDPQNRQELCARSVESGPSDSGCFRFFPLQSEREHPADIAVNKALMLVTRPTIHDYVEIMELHNSYLSLGAICWAACGKDHRFTPWSLLGLAGRFMKFRHDDVIQAHLSRPVSLVELKQAWLKAVDQAESIFGMLPKLEVGALYLSPNFTPVTPDPASPDFPSLIRHYGSIRGAWPVVK